jgi:outer membrane receptor protein involved in Fe transport
VFRQFIFACAVATGTLLASSDPAFVSGKVTDPSGALVKGAKILLHRANGSGGLSRASGSDGRFVFESLAAGDYWLEASAPGLTLGEALNLQLLSGERKEVSLALTVSAVTTLVTVTSSGAPQPVDQVAKALDVVNVDEAEQRGLLSASDALQFLPGLQVTTEGGPGAFTTIQTRGLRVTDTAILLDGFPFRDPTSIQDEASAYIADLFLVDSAHIEALRGSGSSLYGSNAMSGTVNILTDGGGGPLHGDLDLQGGGLGLFHGLAKMSGDAWKKRLNYSAGVSNLSVTEGVDDAGAARDWTGQGSVELLLEPNMRARATVFGNRGYLQLNTSPSPTADAPVSGIIPAVASGANATFIPSLGDPDDGEYSHIVSALFRFEHDVNTRFSYRIGYGIVDSARDYTNGPAGPANEYTYQPAFNAADRYSGRLDTLQARANYLLGAHQTLTAGYEFERENYQELATDQNPDVSLRTYDRTKARQQTNAVFAQDEIRLLEGRLQVLLASRFTQVALDEPAFVGAAVSPYAVVRLPTPPRAYTGDAALSYFFKRASTKIRAHVGNSFRTPSIYERFGGYFYGGVYYPLGDPNLPPERAVSFDSGVDQYLWHEHVKVSGSYFYSRLQKVIGYASFPPNYTDVYGRTAGYYSLPGGMARGLELSADVHPTRKTSLKGSYVYTNARDRTSQYYTGTATDPLQTPRISPQMFSVVATQQLTKRIDAALDFTGGSSYLYPIYGYDAAFNYQPFAYRFAGPKLLGLSAGYAIPFGERLTARFYTRVSNALGQNYYAEGFTTPGRWAVAGVKLSF